MFFIEVNHSDGTTSMVNLAQVAWIENHESKAVFRFSDDNNNLWTNNPYSEIYELLYSLLGSAFLQIGDGK